MKSRFEVRGTSPNGNAVKITVNADDYWEARTKARKTRMTVRDIVKIEDTLPVFNPKAADERITADRQWSAPLKAPAPQKPCDVGMFSDDANQIDWLKTKLP